MIYFFCLEHLQYISTLISDKPDYHKTVFGVQFILDIIRVYYSGMGSTHVGLSDDVVVPLSEEDTQMIRSALLSIINLYLIKQITKEDVGSILNFITSCQDSSLVSYN